MVGTFSCTLGPTVGTGVLEPDAALFFGSGMMSSLVRFVTGGPALPDRRWMGSVSFVLGVIERPRPGRPLVGTGTSLGSTTAGERERDTIGPLYSVGAAEDRVDRLLAFALGLGASGAAELLEEARSDARGPWYDDAAAEDFDREDFRDPGSRLTSADGGSSLVLALPWMGLLLLANFPGLALALGLGGS